MSSEMSQKLHQLSSWLLNQYGARPRAIILDICPDDTAYRARAVLVDRAVDPVVYAIDYGKDVELALLGLFDEILPSETVDTCLTIEQQQQRLHRQHLGLIRCCRKLSQQVKGLRVALKQRTPPDLLACSTETLFAAGLTKLRRELADSEEV